MLINKSPKWLGFLALFDKKESDHRAAVKQLITICNVNLNDLIKLYIFFFRGCRNVYTFGESSEYICATVKTWFSFKIFVHNIFITNQAMIAKLKLVK